MVLLYPTVPEVPNLRLYNAVKKAKDFSDNIINRKISNFSAVLFSSLGLFGRFVLHARVTARFTTWSFLYSPSFIIAGIFSIPFILNRVHKKYDDKIKIINRAHDWSTNVGQHNICKIGAIATAILSLIALYTVINPIIWQALLTASVILSLTTLLLAEIIEKQYKSILSDKSTNNFEISMTRTFGFYFGESKLN